ncbi:hypothetical protein Tco_0927015 [Tanacetum coccineum]|uniref:Uncharacterized protein n=1 Tax=Tanacetum coccineum TaxID=301880 RepID=A0ABQ5DBH5_9ASTR
MFSRLCCRLGKRLLHCPGPSLKVGESSSAAAARSTGGFRVDYGFVGTLDSKIRCDPDREVSYRITDVWVDPAEAVKEIPPTTLDRVAPGHVAQDRIKDSDRLTQHIQHEHGRFREFQRTRDVAPEDVDSSSKIVPCD